MSSTMSVIFADLPKCLSCENIQYKSRSLFREDGCVYADVSFQNPCIHVLEFRCRFPHVPCSSDIGRAILVLTTRINQDWLRRIQVFHQITRLCSIMNDGCVASNARYRGERTLKESGLFRPISSQHLINFHFANRPSFLHYFYFKPSHEMCHSSTIDDVCFSHSFHFSLVFTRFHRRHSILAVDQGILWDDGTQSKIRPRSIHPYFASLCLTVGFYVYNDIII
mmetsp:Transcript_79658/g.119738  ORF Transcript_79658/g.119738 Transcript_79658/m.119738 type:complete len:224 (+) Transcript_79658:393-1064(+)